MPNPPTMALMALPLAGLDAQPARAIWLLVSLAALLAGVAALVEVSGAQQSRCFNPRPDVDAAGTGGLHQPSHRPGIHDRIRGVFTAAALMLLKSAIVPRASASASARDQDRRRSDRSPVDRRGNGPRSQPRPSPRPSSRWPSHRSSTPRFGTIYPSQVRAYVASPASSVTAYQTTLETVQAAVCRRSPMESVTRRELRAIAFVVPTLIMAAATAVTSCWQLRSTASRTMDRRWRNAGGAVPTGRGGVAFRPDGDPAGPAPAKMVEFS